MLKLLSFKVSGRKVKILVIILGEEICEILITGTAELYFAWSCALFLHCLLLQTKQ